MAPFRGLRKCGWILLLGLVFAGLACLLPENAYQRWQLLDGSILGRARWIYERSHFDPTPIDVVFVGPSRTSQGVSAPRLAADLAARGLPHNVVNFSLPATGRDIAYAIVEQMLQQKRPKLLVIGVIEKPSRLGHPAFKFLARPGLVADPGYFGNLSYPRNLAYLPYRQLRLFVADFAPGGAGLTKQFDPANYPGPVVETTGDIQLPDGTVKDGTDPASYRELMRGVHKLERGEHPPFLPARFADEEFGDERYYIRRIVALAHARGVKVAFLFLPYYSGPSTLLEQDFYAQYGPIWNAGFLASHAEWYADYGHLTRAAALRLTDWVAGPVSEMLAPPDKPK